MQKPSTIAEANQALHQRFQEIRRRSLELAQPLSAEDQSLQSMPEASPTKWHLAHTTWFFEHLVLAPNLPGYRPFPGFDEMFNSYYESLGPRHPRPQRGMLSRPSLAEVLEYRRAVDEAMSAMIRATQAKADAALQGTIELGLQHEQQHQELLLTDILHALSLNPLRPAVYGGEGPRVADVPPGWEEHGGGIVQIGHAGGGFLSITRDRLTAYSSSPMR